MLVATFLSDTAAYGAGRPVRLRKITPRISPNKTLEGLIGGFVGATLGFWFAGLYQDWLPGIDALLMGMCIAVIAPIGDLFASMKRDLGAKDTGSLGPHGGLIDRLDAVLFTVVAGYYLCRVRVLRGAAEAQPSSNPLDQVELAHPRRLRHSRTQCGTSGRFRVYGHPNRPQRCR